jgi:hypothetical protein
LAKEAPHIKKVISDKNFYNQYLESCSKYNKGKAKVIFQDFAKGDSEFRAAIIDDDYLLESYKEIQNDNNKHSFKEWIEQDELKNRFSNVKFISNLVAATNNSASIKLLLKEILLASVVNKEIFEK